MRSMASEEEGPRGRRPSRHRCHGHHSSRPGGRKGRAVGGGGQGGQMKVERVMAALFAVSGSWRPWNCRQSTESRVSSGKLDVAVYYKISPYWRVRE